MAANGPVGIRPRERGHHLDKTTGGSNESHKHVLTTTVDGRTREGTPGTGFHDAAETLDAIEQQKALRLLVKDVLIGDGEMTIRHSVPLAKDNGCSVDKLGSHPARQVPNPKVAYCVGGGAAHHLWMAGGPYVIVPCARMRVAWLLPTIRKP